MDVIAHVPGNSIEFYAMNAIGTNGDRCPRSAVRCDADFCPAHPDDDLCLNRRPPRLIPTGRVGSK
jgi:hypothetical protein